MRKDNLTYTTIILLHIAFGVAMYFYSKLSIPYGLAILSIGCLLILKTHNNKNQVLYIAAYTVGSEVMLRMTGGVIFYEIAKYSIVAFMLMSLYLSGFSKNSFPYWIYLVVLIPSVLVASITLNLDSNIIKSISFNLSGPLCLGICALYCYQRHISLKELDNVMFSMLCPIITTVTYMFLYAPSVRDVITGTQSSFETSGGFGPNQVATIVGLGMFLMFTRVIFYSKERKILIINVVLFLILSFRGLVTFSRGGIICSIVMMVLLLFVLFRVIRRSSKVKLFKLILFSVIAMFVIWGYSVLQTNGLINKRYANQDARGRVKESVLTGREVIMEGEYEMFLKNPIMGIGVGKSKENRLAQSSDGESVASHNEITRMLSEHGLLGILALLILIITPLALYINNRQHIYLLSFFTFWILTINHAAMRLAAPAFVYALTLLQVYSVEEQKN
jgi:O-antigen ligase